MSPSRSGPPWTPEAARAGGPEVVVLRVHHRPARAARALMWLDRVVGLDRVVVVDDARAADVRVAHRRLAVGCQRYLDRTARAGLVTRGSPAEQAVLRWGLLGDDDAFTAGAALNTALWVGAGRRVVTLDDDVVPLLAPALDGEAANDADPTALRCFARRADALRSVDLDPAAFSTVLGAARAGPVASVGLVGDAGHYSAAAHLTRGPRWLAGLADRWAELGASREVVRAAPRAAPGRHLMSTCLQLDLTRPLPPLAPEGRNSDGLWGQLLADAGAPATHLPWVVVHAPSPRTETWAGVLEALDRPRPLDVLALAVSVEPGASAPGAPSPGLARLARLGERDARDWLAPHWAARLERVAVTLDDARRRAPASAGAFHADVEAGLQTLLARGGRLRLAATPEAERRAWGRVRDRAAAYLALLEVWRARGPIW